jgi:O-antigen ligase
LSALLCPGVLARAALLLAAFFLPLGTAPMKLFLWAGVLAGLPTVLRNITLVLKSSVAAWSLLLFVWILLSQLWTIGAAQETFEFLSRYARFGLICLLAGILVGHCRAGAGNLIRFEPRYGQVPSFNLFEAFIWGALAAALITWATWLGIPQGLAGVADDQRVLLGPANGQAWISFGTKFEPNFAYTHIAASAFLVFAANLVLVTWNQGKRRTVQVAAALFLATPVLFMQSRTGYLLLGVSVCFWVWRVFSLRGLRTGLVSLAGVSLIAIMAISTLPNLKTRLLEAVSDVQYFSQTRQYQDRSQAIRLQFWSVAVSQALQSPSDFLFGSGVGSYSSRYQTMTGQSVPEPSGQPHNEYLALLSQTGLVGLVLFVGLLAAALRATVRHAGLAILPILLVVDALFNSVIWNMEEGHWALLLFASLAAGQIKESLTNQHRV